MGYEETARSKYVETVVLKHVRFQAQTIMTTEMLDMVDVQACEDRIRQIILVRLTAAMAAAVDQERIRFHELWRTWRYEWLCRHPRIHAWVADRWPEWRFASGRGRFKAICPHAVVPGMGNAEHIKWVVESARTSPSSVVPS